MIRVLFVCKTNSATSPLAAGLFNHLASDLNRREVCIEAFSRGSFPGNHARGADRRAISFALKQGFDISSHRTQEVSAQDLTDARYVFCADEDSYWFVDRLAKESGQNFNKPKRLQLLTEESLQMGQRTIPDPVLGEGTFEESCALVLKYVQRLFDRLTAAEQLGKQ